jgi:hypothetical protein
MTKKGAACAASLSATVSDLAVLKNLEAPAERARSGYLSEFFVTMPRNNAYRYIERYLCILSSANGVRVVVAAGDTDILVTTMIVLAELRWTPTWVTPVGNFNFAVSARPQCVVVCGATRSAGRGAIPLNASI